MSGRVYLSGVALALVTGAFLLTDHLLTPPPGVTEANCRRIRVGMRRAEVERLLGSRGISLGRDHPYFSRNWEYMGWLGEAGAVEVVFDKADRVVSAYGVWEGPPGPLARLRAWLGW
jgi:hypothetical protein